MPSTKSGLVLSKSTPSSALMAGHTAGPRTDTLVLKVHTTAVLALAESTAATLSRLTTRRACMLVSRFQAPMLRSCLPSGSTRLVHVLELTVGQAVFVFKGPS
jgi:hypothetical protein